jgi:hypothetical protein
MTRSVASGARGFVLRVYAGALELTNRGKSSTLAIDAFLHRQHGLSPLPQLLLLYALSV